MFGFHRRKMAEPEFGTAHRLGAPKSGRPSKSTPTKSTTPVVWKSNPVKTSPVNTGGGGNGTSSNKSPYAFSQHPEWNQYLKGEDCYGMAYVKKYASCGPVKRTIQSENPAPFVKLWFNLP